MLFNIILVKISKSSKPDKQTPSSTSPLAVSSSPIVESPNVPSTSESAHISTTSATGRVATDLGNINDSDTDSGECNKTMALHVCTMS